MLCTYTSSQSPFLCFPLQTPRVGTTVHLCALSARRRRRTHVCNHEPFHSVCSKGSLSLCARSSEARSFFLSLPAFMHGRREGGEIITLLLFLATVAAAAAAADRPTTTAATRIRHRRKEGGEGSSSCSRETTTDFDSCFFSTMSSKCSACDPKPVEDVQGDNRWMSMVRDMNC